MCYNDNFIVFVHTLQFQNKPQNVQNLSMICFTPLSSGRPTLLF